MTTAPLLLIVGMHRSGTSLLGSLLPACGIAMPGPLISGDLHNPEGYFERADVTALQEQLLIDLERWWPSPRGMHPLPEGWLESPLGQRALADLIALLQPEAERQQGPWAIKDPRSSLLLPLWKAACQQLAIPLKLLLAVRDPAEVMVSLVRRDQAVTGMDGWRAQRLWWHHNAQVLRDGADLPLQVVSYSHWFDPANGLQQLRGLAPSASDGELSAVLHSCVKPAHRRSQGQNLETSLAGVVLSCYKKLNALALIPASEQPRAIRAILHWIHRTQELSAAAPLPRKRSRVKRWLRHHLKPTTALDASQHPWSYLAQMVCGSQAPASAHQIQWWSAHGFRSFELEQFRQLPGSIPAAARWAGYFEQESAAVQLRGDLLSWGSHAWLQHCPISPTARELTLVSLGQHGAAPVALNLCDLEPGLSCSQELLHLASLEAVWDPDPTRVRLLRQFGISAYWLRQAEQSHPALKPDTATWADCSTQLGLPAPNSLAKLGTILCLGLSSRELEQSFNSPLLGIPGFDHLPIQSQQHAQLVAQWLQGCLNAGLELVHFSSPHHRTKRQAWQGLMQHIGSERAPILLLPEPLGASELLEELNWYRRGCPEAGQCITPQPTNQILADYTAQDPSISVCISLYNYADRVENALNSIRTQINTSSIELIIVDDASTDHGATVVENWIRSNHQAFARCLLLQHEENGGLASARNSAFTAARSPWCFVLDADNQIEPEAIQHLQIIASRAHSRCGVVHSLIRVLPDDPNQQDPRALVSDRPWIRKLFEESNYIDAMALVRRSAWQEVGGYTHIAGGWEDYDFWCCLIEAGWHGVVCPQTLATYWSHNTSMRNQTTNQRSYELSRILQSRHPWLNLVRANNHAVTNDQASS